MYNATNMLNFLFLTFTISIATSAKLCRDFSEGYWMEFGNLLQGMAFTLKRASISRVVQQHTFLPADGPMAGGHVVLTANAPPVLQESECKHILSIRIVI